jgi:hypothetical protein
MGGLWTRGTAKRRMLRRGAGTVGFAAACVALLSGMASAGAGWQVTTMPHPSGAHALVPEGVSCPAKNDCTAVGIYHQNGNHTLAERWDGASWTVEPMPSLPSDLQNPLSLGVSCASATSCVAVVWSSPPSIGGSASLVERWNGSRWAIQRIPLPAGGTQSTLNAVSCPSPVNCTAVGAFHQENSAPVPLAEHWDGTAWTAQALPLPPGIGSGQLGGVSCPTARHCTAVGNYSEFNQGQGLIAEQWNGSRWTVQTPPLPAGSSFGLNSVSCPSALSCTAAGASFNASAAAENSIVERWNGASWALQADAAPAQTILYGVSCPSARSCTAVGGTWTGNVSQSTVVAESWNGTTWLRLTLPLPPATTSSGLYGVSCVEPAYCTALGGTTPNHLIAEQEQ